MPHVRKAASYGPQRFRGKDAISGPCDQQRQPREQPIKRRHIESEIAPLVEGLLMTDGIHD
jgi:hypothetical protein